MPNAKPIQKRRTITFRATHRLSDQIEAARKQLQRQRAPGSNEITLTETLQILIENGAKKVLAKNYKTTTLG